ncbi:hypothetical protein BGX21_006693 [Mortierella sp. AD011]|nr:hypothetical protein BGX21_006693 [Mortierella sp. AD011]
MQPTIHILTLVAVISSMVAAVPIQVHLDPKVQQLGPVPHYALNIDGSIKVSGRIISEEYVQITGLATEGSECTASGLVGQDGGGKLLTCQMGIWLYPKIKTEVKEHSEIGYRFPNASVSCGPYQRVIGGGGSCHQTGGFIWVTASKPFQNGWRVECDGGQKDEWGTAKVWAICGY